MVQIHQINFRLKRKKRIGRGRSRGNYSGRGIKGQKARAGRKIKPMLREIIMKFPKLRGIGNVKKLKPPIFEINLEDINEKFFDNEKVSIASLQEKGLLEIPKSCKTFKVKILGKGDLERRLIFDRNLLISQSALQKIEKSGSRIQ